jgi:2-polyprenyl-6-methoxyphenol hydroxylase-like FAD-dependent oxidoreductase
MLNTKQRGQLQPGLKNYREGQNANGTSFRAVVSGASITGVVCALRLAKRGFSVDVYEKRPQYLRNIQWGARQSLIDTLAKIDQSLSAIFTEDIAAPLPGGSRFVAEVSSLYEHGAYLNKKRPTPEPGNEDAETPTGIEMLEKKTVCAFSARKCEEFLSDYAKMVPLIKWHAGSCPQPVSDTVSHRYIISGSEPPDLIVIAEGANSESRRAVGINTFPVSRATRQVAGSVYMRRHGIMIKHLHAETSEEGEEEFLLSGLISAGHETTSWVVGDLSDKLSQGLDNAKSDTDRSELLKRAFTQMAARCTLSSEQNIEEAKFEGAIVEKDVEDFYLSSNFSETAIAGDNLVFVGDSVGNGHWSVGGGMQVGAVLHSSRVDMLAQSIVRGDDRNESLGKFNKTVREDTKAWLLEGISDFYIGVPKKLVDRSFENALHAREGDKASDFLETMQKGILAGLFPARLSRLSSAKTL